MLDHPLSRRVSVEGASHEIIQREILAENLITKPLPRDFDPSGFALAPFNVTRWLRDGDRIDFGGWDLEVIYTPGEAADHIAFWIELTGYFSAVTFCLMVQCGHIWKLAIWKTWLRAIGN